MAGYGPPTVEEYLADLNKQLSKSKKKLKKTIDSIEAVNKALVRLKEEVYSLADARSKVPQIIYLLRNFEQQELYGTKQGKLLSETSGVLGLSSYKNEEGPLERLILDTMEVAMESGMSEEVKEFTSAVLEFLEFDGRNQPKYSISEDYKKLFEEGIYEITFWDNFSSVVSNEIERRQDAVNRLTQALPRLRNKKAGYESDIKTTQDSIDKTNKDKDTGESPPEPVPAPLPAQPTTPTAPNETVVSTAQEDEAAVSQEEPEGPGPGRTRFESSIKMPTLVDRKTGEPILPKSELHYVPGEGITTRSVGEKTDQRPKRTFPTARDEIRRMYEKYPETVEGRVSQIWSLFARNLTSKGLDEDNEDYAVALLEESPTFTSGFRAGVDIGSNAAFGVAVGAARAIGKTVIKEAAKKIALKAGIQVAANVVAPGVGIVAGIVISKAVDLALQAWNKTKKYLAAGAAYLYLKFVQAFGPAMGWVANFLGLGNGFALGGGAATATTASAAAGAPIAGISGSGATSVVTAGNGLINSILGSGSEALVTGWGGINIGGLVVGPTTALIGTTVVFTAVTLILSSSTDAALLANAQVLEFPPDPPLFEVVKTPSVASLKNDSGLQTVSYQIRITPNSGTTITMVEDEGKVYTSAGTETIMSKHSLNTANPIDSVSVNTNKYNDSTLINTVTVTATGADGKVQQRTAVAIVIIGSPKNEPPYGFPLGSNATITTLDDEELKIGAEPAYRHCGEVYGTADCPRGGLDIGATGDVHSTVTGYVAFAGWNDRIGGYVGIVSGPYYVAFIHLKTPSIAVGTQVKRNDVVGQVYLGPGKNEVAPTRWNGAHLHYQVLAGGANMIFADSKNAGPCKDTSGKRTVAIEPTALTKNSTVSYDPNACK